MKSSEAIEERALSDDQKGQMMLQLIQVPRVSTPKVSNDFSCSKLFFVVKKRRTDKSVLRFLEENHGLLGGGQERPACRSDVCF